MNEHLCPFCGSDTVVEYPTDGSHNRAICGHCEQEGPEVHASDGSAIDAFCFPAHIMRVNKLLSTALGIASIEHAKNHGGDAYSYGAAVIIVAKNKLEHANEADK